VSPAGPEAYDLITLGRSSIDLYSNDLGAPFEAITSFAAYVGGSPTNIAVGARRLGLKVALLTALGPDKVGDFVRHFLDREGVDTRFVPVKEGKRTSAVLLGIEQDRVPLVYYRDNCADMALTIDDVAAAPIAASAALEISATALAADPSRSAAFFAAEAARGAGRTVYLDLDFRADQWFDPRAYGLAVRALLPLVTVAFGTEEEVNAAMLTDPRDLVITEQQISAPVIRGDVEANIAAMLGRRPGPEALLVKRGGEGCTVHLEDGSVTAVPGFEVEVMNVLGAGDAFAAGVIYGRSRGWDWAKSARMGNACGAIVVTRHGCANFMAYEEEALVFIVEHGGF
jgi:5-dehydro-2-deoxygluconokinase